MPLRKTEKNVRRIAVSAMISALSFALMYIGTLAVVFDLCAVVLGAIGTAFAVIELRGAWPWLIAAVCSVLCLLLLPDKFAAVEYIILGGVYPIIKEYIERLPKLLQWPLKLVYFNALFTGGMLLAKYVMMINEDWVAFNIVIYALSNITFIVFDIALTVFISAYLTRFRKRMKFRF